jgi:hypothetical protein
MGERIADLGLNRRLFLKAGFAGAAAFLAGCAERDRTAAGPTGPVSNIPNLGPLQSADPNGVKLPAGFTSRIVAQSGSVPNSGGSYSWHAAPDGGACFTKSGGGWIYVSNSELGSNGGGVGALEFDASGALTNAYSICSNTSRNCAAGVRVRPHRRGERRGATGHGAVQPRGGGRRPGEPPPLPD